METETQNSQTLKVMINTNTQKEFFLNPEEAQALLWLGLDIWVHEEEKEAWDALVQESSQRSKKIHPTPAPKEEQPSKTPNPVLEPLINPKEKKSNEVFRCILRVFRSKGVVFLMDMPLEGQGEKERQLFQNLLKKLSFEQNREIDSLFVWPLSRKLSSLSEAKKAFFEMKWYANSQKVEHLVLLGEGMLPLIEAKKELQSFIQTHSLSLMLKEPQRRQEAWNALSPLR